MGVRIMKSYKIDIVEEYCKTVEIEAENRDEADKNLTKEYSSGKIEIGKDDYLGANFYFIGEDSSEPISELMQTLVSILQLNGVFVRNLFRENVLRDSMNQNTLYAKYENTFLLAVEDRMHNIPDLVRNLLQYDDDKRIGIDSFLLSLVSGCLKEFNSLVQDKDTRISYGIRDTKNIQSWLTFGLKGMISYSEKAIELMERIKTY